MIMKKFWIINAVLAVIAAVLGVMQEVRLGTPIYFWNAFGLSASYAVAFACASEIVKILPKFINYWHWQWKDVIIGCVFGIAAAIITTLAVC